MLVIDKAIRYYTRNGQVDAAGAKTRIRSVDMLLVLVLSAYILHSFYKGFKGEGDYNQITNGLFAFVLLGISFSLILNSKLNADYWRSGDTKLSSTDDSTTGAGGRPKYDIMDAFKLIGSCIGYIFSPLYALYNVICVAIIVILILLFLSPYVTNTIDITKFRNYLNDWVLMYVPVFVSLFTFLIT